MTIATAILVVAVTDLNAVAITAVATITCYDWLLLFSRYLADMTPTIIHTHIVDEDVSQSEAAPF